MSDDSGNSGSPRSAILDGHVGALLGADGVSELISESRQRSVLAEVTRDRTELDLGDELGRWRLSLALERLAQSVRAADRRRRLFDQAFVCRRAVNMDRLNVHARFSHLVCLASDALAADRRAELIMLLRDLPSEELEIPQDVDWQEELFLRISRAYIVMARRSSGWDDVRAAADEIERLRMLQSHREGAVLADAGHQVLSSLVALYNLARMVDLVAEYLVSGSPGDVAIRVDRHHGNVSEIGELEPMPEITHLADLLHIGLRALIDASIWTVTRGLGARIGAFVEELAGRNRENPILELWPSQRRALRSSLLDPAKRALVVQMPTSAGKTLVAEFAIVQALALNPDATVAYVVPTRALVNQITVRLRADLSPLRLNVEAAVPVFELDPVEDSLLRGARIDVLITTPEKLDLLLRQRHPAVRDLALTVSDEAHNLGDGTRGARLELLLGTVKREHPSSRFLLLSPFLPNSEDIAEWLGDDPDATVAVDWKPTELVTAAASWTRERSRPFELELLTIPSAHYVDLDTEVKIELGQASPQRSARSKGAISVSSALRLTERGSVLILCRGRTTAENRASEISHERHERHMSALGTAVIAYAESELGRAHPLPGLLRRGVAYHHAGLSHDLRYLIERLIDSEDVDIVCGTTTLAQGVNFPIASVIVETLKKPKDPRGWEDLTYSDFWNVAGRAGRALRDRLGLVVYPSATPADKEVFRSYLRNEATELVSVLVSALSQIDAAADEFNLAFVRRHPAMAIFMQYVAHALSVGGFENARVEVEDLLRSSFVYHQAESENPLLARRLVAITRRYLDSMSGKSSAYLRLADGTGFSLQSVDYLYALQQSEHQEFEDPGFWEPESLFSADLANLTSLVDVLGRIPELTLGRQEGGGSFDAETVAGIIRDWIDGATVDEIADRWFRSVESDPDNRRRRAGHYLYSRLVGQVPWGTGAIQRLALSSEVDLQRVGHVPSLMFYGVRTREAAALRMAGVPRIAAEGLASLLRSSGGALASGGFEGVRSWLSARGSEEWERALPAGSPLRGEDCRRVWRVLAGGSGP